MAHPQVKTVSHTPLHEASDSSTVQLSDWEGQDTTRKASRFTPPTLQLSEVSSLKGRVQISPSTDEVGSDIKNLKTYSGPNFMVKVQEIIAKLLTLYMKIHETERLNKNEEKKKYTEANKNWGVSQREIGDRGMNLAYVSLALMGAQFLFPKNDREIINFFAKEGTEKYGHMLNSETQSKQQVLQGIAQLASTELSALINKGSSDANKQELISLLEKALELLRRAAQSS